MFTDIEIIIGHHRRNRTPLPLESVTRATNWITQFLRIMYGGVQIIGSIRCGEYTAQDGQAMQEPCTVVRAYAPTFSDSDRILLRETTAVVAAALDQECILLAITPKAGDFWLVEPILGPADAGALTNQAEVSLREPINHSRDSARAVAPVLQHILGGVGIVSVLLVTSSLLWSVVATNEAYRSRRTGMLFVAVLLSILGMLSPTAAIALLRVLISILPTLATTQ